ncbi:MAG: peptidyl-prolyl cis-trans isomerase [Congregibacter sp.]
MGDPSLDTGHAQGGLRATVMRRLLRAPFLQFFSAGALLFAGFAMLETDDRETIVLSDAGLAMLVGEFEMLTGSTPTESDRQRLVDQFYERELLYREGLRTEIFRDDGELRELIIERMQQRASGELPSPDGRQLVNYYADNLDRYYREAEISFEQLVYQTKPANADALLAQLRAGLASDGAVPRQTKQFPNYGESMLRGLFGQALLEVLQDLPLDQWQGPFQSVLGWHYFRVAGRRERTLLPYERAREQVAADYQAQVLAQRVLDFVDARRGDYPFQRKP